ncbi:MAG: Rieske 2Fe-2S domain-containing protein [Acidiferrobacterales bacterium]|nr:Rieske 2Fe-2S domain-containing protein [Acidiferrobacterales bacterium]
MKSEKINLIGSAQDLEEGGKGLLFEVRKKGEEEVIPAFVIRFDYQFFAYLNRCGHIAVQLDYMPGEFFSDDGQTLVCATHGAEYAPDTGACLGGPCFGVGLDPIELEESEGQLYLNHSDYEVVKANV